METIEKIQVKPGVEKVGDKLVMHYCNRLDLYKVEATYDEDGNLVSEDAVVVQENCSSCVQEVLGM